MRVAATCKREQSNSKSLTAKSIKHSAALPIVLTLTADTRSITKSVTGAGNEERLPIASLTFSVDEERPPRASLI